MSQVSELEPVRKKKILVLISVGGGGHKAAGESLKEILSGSYEVEIVNPLEQMLRPIDSLSLLTFGKFTSEDLYNLSLRKGYHKLIKCLFCHVGTSYMRSKRRHVQKLFDKYLLKQAHYPPSLVISTFPMINAPLFEAAHEHDIPVLILPTDLDSETFLLGIDEVQIKEDAKLVVALPYDDPDLHLKAVREGQLKAKNLHVTGFPVRPACQKKYHSDDIAHLKNKHGIRELLPTLTLIMGAEGGDAILSYADELAKITLDSSENNSFQINICVGRNRRIAQQIREKVLQEGGILIFDCSLYATLLTHKGVYLHIRQFTKEIVEIMACSDLIITKTGSCSVNEAIYLGKRLLLDNTENSSARHIWWESFNVSFVKKHNLGDAFCQLSELRPKALALLNISTQPPSARGDFRLPSFEQNISLLVESMIYTPDS